MFLNGFCRISQKGWNDHAHTKHANNKITRGKFPFAYRNFVITKPISGKTSRKNYANFSRGVNQRLKLAGASTIWAGASNIWSLSKHHFTTIFIVVYGCVCVYTRINLKVLVFEHQGLADRAPPLTYPSPKPQTTLTSQLHWRFNEFSTWTPFAFKVILHTDDSLQKNKIKLRSQETNKPLIRRLRCAIKWHTKLPTIAQSPIHKYSPIHN